VRVDGASRGNPGPAGIGAVVEFSDGRAPVERNAYIGETTNNVAEYRALLLALEEAGRTDLIGGGCDALIPSAAPPEAL